ncbi:hypothetical protein BCR39DRAFT_509147 [Naematelia encephala]|uniref:N-acetyltransferase domain-containing protein n=1 Tax=Naematelia encephala TaxID=71784 RepID=A0A1Y2BKR7_9TREE|nr:hypothetical protein BCR39DRAFT_509147 [Naematelia encephala]
MLDPAGFTIVIASAEQEEQHARGQFVPWARGRSWEDFVAIHQQERREGIWSKDKRLLTWVLVKRDALDGEIYAGCETYRRTALVRRKGSEEVEQASTYGIASVVTPVKHLRQGYATHLLRLLHYMIAEPTFLPCFPSTWGNPPPCIPDNMARYVPKAISSILWSDVGSIFYERCTIGESRKGWVVRDDQCFELVWKLHPPPLTDTISESIEELHDVSGIADEMTASHLNKLRDIDIDNCGQSVWTTEPSSTGVMDFIAEKGKYGSQSEERDSSKAEVRGLRYHGSKKDGSDDTVILFTPYNINIGARLLITATLGLEAHPERLEALIGALDKYGIAAKRTEGWIWGLGDDSEVVRRWKSLDGREVRCGRRAEKDGHLLGVAWYGHEGDSADMLDTSMWSWC